MAKVWPEPEAVMPVVTGVTDQLTGWKFAGVGFGTAVKLPVVPPPAGMVAAAGAVTEKGPFGSMNCRPIVLFAEDGAVSVTVKVTVLMVVPPAPEAVSCGVPEMTPAALIVIPAGRPVALQL